MIRLGVIGYGERINAVINSAFRQICEDLRVVGIVDPDKEGVMKKLAEQDRKDVKFYDSLDSLIKEGKVDAIAIGTRCNLHTPYAIEASKYDIPLFLEKPISISMEQAISLEEAYQNSRCEVVVSFPLRVSPLVRLAKKYIEDGTLGRTEHITGLNYVPYGYVYFQRGYRDYNITQGLFLQKATHDLDYIMHLTGEPITEIAAMTTKGRVWGGDKPEDLHCEICPEREDCPESPKNRRLNSSVEWDTELEDHLCPFSKAAGTPETGMNEDSSSAIFRFKSGIHGVYTQVFFSRRTAKKRGAIISGYNGTIEFEWYKNMFNYHGHHNLKDDIINIGSVENHFGGDIELARNFIDVIKGRNKSLSTIWDGLRSTYTCLAAKESDEKGGFVKVRQVGQVS